MAQGRDAVLNLLKDNPEMAAEIEQKIRTKIKGGEVALPEDRTVDEHGEDAETDE